jgi:hypothetical protein
VWDLYTAYIPPTINSTFNSISAKGSAEKAMPLDQMTGMNSR